MSLTTRRRPRQKTRDPSSLLFDDAQISNDSHLRLPVKKLGLYGLSWPAALAWICARETRFVEAFERRCRETLPVLSEARALLAKALEEKRPQAPGNAASALNLAEDQLHQLLGSGSIIKADGKPLKGQASILIPRESWLCFERTSSEPYDALYDWHKSAVTFTDIRIREAGLLNRWEERPLARVLCLTGKTWNLPETLYWIAHQSHQGYGEHTLYDKGSALEQLGEALRTKRIVCRASIRSERPGVRDPDLQVEDRSHEFWMRFGIEETAIAEFDEARVRKLWPMHEQLAGFRSQKDAIAYLRKTLGTSFRQARTMVHQAGVPKGKPGPEAR